MPLHPSWPPAFSKRQSFLSKDRLDVFNRHSTKQTFAKDALHGCHLGTCNIVFPSGEIQLRIILFLLIEPYPAIASPLWVPYSPPPPPPLLPGIVHQLPVQIQIEVAIVP
jgi:hypothetical protein